MASSKVSELVGERREEADHDSIPVPVEKVIKFNVVIQYGRVSTAVFWSAIVHQGTGREKEIRIWISFIPFFLWG